MSTSPLRLVRWAPDPLGPYVRAERFDQKDLQSFFTSGSAAFTASASMPCADAHLSPRPTHL